MLVGVPDFDCAVRHPRFLLFADRTVEDKPVVLRCTKKTPQSEPIPTRHVLEDAAAVT